MKLDFIIIINHLIQLFQDVICFIVIHSIMVKASQNARRQDFGPRDEAKDELKAYNFGKGQEPLPDAGLPRTSGHI